MNSCAPKNKKKLFITLWLLTSALLRPLPIGESENAPLPFSAASTLSHGIASPLPAVSESGKVKPRPPLALPNVPAALPPVHLPVTMSVFVYLGWAVDFSHGRLSSSCDACSVGLCAHDISSSFCCVSSAVAVTFFFLSQKTLRGNNTVTLQTQWMGMNLNHVHVLSGWIKTKPFHLFTVEGP